jgi:uncharacterized protein YhfF
MDPSVGRMWVAYLEKSLVVRASPPAWHFCDNQPDADTCAALVLAGRKRATAPLLWFFESRGLALPAVGDLDIVTNWDGIAQCIIRTTTVQIVRFIDVTAEQAVAEGEGDGSLEFWRSTQLGVLPPRTCRNRIHAD